MNLTFDPLGRFALVTGLGLAGKATLVLAMGAGVAALLRHGSAAARHFVWLLTLITVLGVTLLTALPRGLEVAVPHWPPAATEALRLAGKLEPAPGGQRATIGSSRDVGTRDVAGASGPSPAASLGSAMAGVWLLGTLLLLAWFAIGHLGLARLASRAQPIRDPEWRSLLERLATELAAPPDVRLYRSRAVTGPLVGGLWRPSILLPLGADSWSPERRRVVLLHELAHVVRRDPLAQWIAWLACSIYWFHPAIWIAAARLRAEGERACDDRVVAMGVEGPDYAAHLLNLARQLRTLNPMRSAEIAMARRSTLEGRLLALLDRGLRRGKVSMRGRGAGIAALSVVVVVLGLARPVPWAAAGSESKKARSAMEARADREDETGPPSFERSVTARSGEVLVLQLETGGSVTIRGWDEPRVQVRGWLDSPKDQPQTFRVERQGRRVILRVEPEIEAGSSWAENHFAIRVPRRFGVRLRSAGGRLSVEDVEGDLDGSSGGGGFVIEHVRGRASLSTGGGDIQVTDCELSGSVATGGGMVTLSRVRGGLKGSSGSGPVIYTDDPGGSGAGDLDDVEVDDSRTTITYGEGEDRDQDREETPIPSRSGMLHIEKAGGAIRVAEAPNGVRAVTGGGKIAIGRSGAMVDASTGGGDVEIGPATGSVKAGTGSGEIHVVLAPGRSRRTVDLISGNGRIVLKVPPELEVDLELETAYTRETRPSRIRSDVPIELEPTTDWDDTEGTPRRYVRARSASGDGVRVTIKTVNGDIEIRRLGR